MLFNSYHSFFYQKQILIRNFNFSPSSENKSRQSRNTTKREQHKKSSFFQKKRKRKRQRERERNRTKTGGCNPWMDRESTDDSQRNSFRLSFIPQTCGLMLSLADGNACNFYNTHALRSSAPLKILKSFRYKRQHRHPNCQ